MAAQRQNGSVVYSFATPHDRKASTIYINVVKKYGCPNSCRFCSRRDAMAGRPNIYENKAGVSLFLNEAPSVENIVSGVRTVRANAKKHLLGFLGAREEIAFVGLGEPLAELPLVCNAIAALRKGGHKGRIRVDTDGLVKCIYPHIVFGCVEKIPCNPASELKNAGLTDIRISVNATNARDYNALCRPAFKDAFEKICEFTLDCMDAGIRTCASFVVGFNDDEVRTKEAAEYVSFARALGIKPKNVLLRTYVPPVSQ